MVTIHLILARFAYSICQFISMLLCSSFMDETNLKDFGLKQIYMLIMTIQVLLGWPQSWFNFFRRKHFMLGTIKLAGNGRFSLAFILCSSILFFLPLSLIIHDVLFFHINGFTPHLSFLFDQTRRRRKCKKVVAHLIFRPFNQLWRLSTFLLFTSFF